VVRILEMEPAVISGNGQQERLWRYKDQTVLHMDKREKRGVMRPKRESDCVEAITMVNYRKVKELYLYIQWRQELLVFDIRYG
jgi:hypothetical protein